MPLVRAAEGEPTRLAPTPCPHRDSSQALILEAARARATPPRSALIIGGAACREIPLVPLCQAIDKVCITDIDQHALARLETVMAAAELTPNAEYRVEDITGCTERLLAEADERMAVTIMPEQALATLIDLVDQADVTRPEPEPDARHDLVVASCVVTQIHLRLQDEIGRRFGARFPLDRAMLKNSAAWLESMLRLTHRMQDAFCAHVASLLDDHGIAYLSATVQVAELALADDGAWLCPGWYRMMRHRHLVENIGPGFAPKSGGEWPWVVRRPTATAGGVIYRVQAVIAGKAAPGGHGDGA